MRKRYTDPIGSGRVGLLLASMGLTLVATACADTADSSGDEVGLEVHDVGVSGARVEEGKELLPPDSPGYLSDVSYSWGCEDSICNVLQVEDRMIRRGEEPGPDYEYYENVRLQRERLPEFQDLTKETLAQMPTECDSTPEHFVDTRIPVTIMLTEQPFDFTRYREAGADRKLVDSLNDERRAQIQPMQERMGRLLQALGAEYQGGRFLVNLVHAEVPVCALSAVAALDDVVAVEAAKDYRSDIGGYGRRGALGVPFELLGPPAPGAEGLDAGHGSRRSATPRVRFGVIESDNPLNTSHYSFRDGSGTGTRIVDTDRCTYWFPSVRCINTATTTANTHGTNVVSVLIGDLSDGQDPLIGDPIDRIDNSGVAPEGEVHYYSVEGWHGGTAIDEAVAEDGVDIINMSQGPITDFCKNNSFNGYREAIEAATNAGVMVVVSAGNNGEFPGCNVSGFGAFPDTMTVGGTTGSYTRIGLDTVARSPESSWGFVSITLRGGLVVGSRMVDVVTNYKHRFATGGTSAYSDGSGTSFSAPAIAGVAGLLHHWVDRRNGLLGLQDDPYAYRVLLSVMADGRAHPTGQYYNAIDDSMGFGNIRFVDLDQDLGDAGGWSVRRTTMSQGSTYEWPVGTSAAESSLLNGWKFAALIDHNRYGDSPDISFRLIDKCPVGGGEATIMTAHPFPLKARMRILSSQVSSKLRGRCLWVRATVNHASGPVKVYTADLYYSNERVKHNAP